MSYPARRAHMLHVLAWLTGAGLAIAWIASGMTQRDALRGELVALRAHHALLAQATAQADSLP